MDEVYLFENQGGVVVKGLPRRGSCIGSVLSWLRMMLKEGNPKFPVDLTSSQVVLKRYSGLVQPS